MNSPLQKLQAVPSTQKVSCVLTEKLADLERRYDAGEFEGLDKWGVPLKEDYEDQKALLLSKRKEMYGTSLQIGTIKLNVNPVEANLDSDGNLKFKNKGRGKNMVVGGGNAIKGGQVMISGEGHNGKSVQGSCCNVESIIAIARNADKVLEYLARPHMSYRNCQQQRIEEGALTPEELFQ